MKKHHISRRHFLNLLSGALLAPSSLTWANPSPKKILLRSSWNINNIGDIAHTPGMLALLEKYIPEAEIILAPWNVGMGVDAMLMKRFPRLYITKNKAESEASVEKCDFFLHGSGPGLLAGNYAQQALNSRKPYGIGGVTLTDGELKAKLSILNGANFVYTRDSESLRALKQAGCACPLMDFGPDAAFAVDLRNEPAADALMKKFQLESGKFLCAIPRPRWAPHEETHPNKLAENKELNPKDHDKVVQAITAWVRETKMRVLIASETVHDVPLLKSLLFDPLPEDVKPYVATMDRFWLTDEAASVYARAAAMISIEQHSPIIAIANGVPAILLRQPIPSIRRKAEMWKDLGMSDWLFDIEECTGEEVSQRLLKIARDLPTAKTLAVQAQTKAHELMKNMMMEIRSVLY